MTEPTRSPRRKTLSDRQVANLKRKKKRYILADPEQRGHYIRVPPEGPAVFAAVARSPYGKQVWAKIGNADTLGIKEARDKAREVIGRIQKGLSAFEPPPVQPDSFGAVAENWLARHVKAKGLRTGTELKRLLTKYVLPHWSDRPFTEIKRSDIARLLDAVEDAHGHWVADRVLMVLRAVASWYGARDDSYTPPFVKNMRRTPPHARKRARVLSDDELSRVWKTAAAGDDVYGAFVRVALLCGQRREKIAKMKWDDVSPDGVWTIPTQPREKPNAGVLKLPKLALEIINAQPRMAGNPYVFAGNKGAISSFFSRHITFKARCGVDGFHIHDLRRSARSLMSRAGVPSEHAERVLGHVLPGVEGVYNVHGYDDEKTKALKRLAALITQIVDGKPDNVVPLRAPAAQP